MQHPLQAVSDSAQTLVGEEIKQRGNIEMSTDRSHLAVSALGYRPHVWQHLEQKRQASCDRCHRMRRKLQTHTTRDILQIKLVVVNTYSAACSIFPKSSVASIASARCAQILRKRETPPLDVDLVHQQHFLNWFLRVRRATPAALETVAFDQITNKLADFCPWSADHPR